VKVQRTGPDRTGFGLDAQMTSYRSLGHSREIAVPLLASTARRPGTGDRMIARTCNAANPMNSISPITKIVTAGVWRSGRAFSRHRSWFVAEGLPTAARAQS
jgi:hypothetical protein